VTIRVVIADDQALVRAGFSVLVNSAPDLMVVGEARNGADAVTVVARTSPDVVLMDVRMPTLDGIAATRLITQDPGDRDARVLILTTFDLDEYVFDALRAGASGFLLKDTPPESLLEAIRVIAAGDALLAPRVTRRLIAAFAQRRAPTPTTVPLHTLTVRERDVLIALAHGASNAEIGDELHMSLATVKTHVSRVLSKLDARDRTQLVVLAYQSGLVEPGNDGLASSD
jgi:DNA-binding NarL/FixJ family response regulator